MPRPKKIEESIILSDAAIKNAGVVFSTLKYSPEDMEKLDQFAIGLLRDGTGAYEVSSAGLVNRIKDAYLRAEVMLTVRKQIAALEA